MKRFALVLLFVTSCAAFGKTEMFHIAGDFYGEYYYTQPSPFEDEKVSIMPMIYYGNEKSKNLMSLNCHRRGDDISSHMFYDYAWSESVFFEFDNGVKVKHDLGFKEQSLTIDEEILELMFALNTMIIHSHKTYDGWENQEINLKGFTNAYEVACGSIKERR